jgi:CrcB protein
MQRCRAGRQQGYKASMDKVLLVAIGGATGSAARYATGVALGRWLGAAYPFGTLTVNVLGGLAMGLVMGWLGGRQGADPDRLRLLLGTGFLGGFTTFSAFSLETVRMIERRDLGQAFGYVMVSVAASIAAVLLGLVLARRLSAA